MPKFDAKSFNAEAFGKYIETVPHPNRNELIKSGVLKSSETIKNLLSSQTGSYFGTIPLFGRIGGAAVNYDGTTDIDASSMDTFEQSVIALGRAKAWTEKDFSVDITAGVDFMDEVGKQTGLYWDDQYTGLVLSVLKGIFAMTGEANKAFVDNHTFNITEEIDNELKATTLNSAVQKASGDKRAKFSMVFMHSAVATNLENKNLLEYLKYTDANGMQRSLPMATWNGRRVIVDDGMPYTVKDDGSVEYTTYLFGEGAIHYANLGAEVPTEMARDPKTNGGQ
ncbi:MAG: hypothetical protein IKB61_02145, partial [Elusimicrobiaceae bacterium]|nr:hypothetical protein [Elusimicrobiaceae bacterium]